MRKASCTVRKFSSLINILKLCFLFFLFVVFFGAYDLTVLVACVRRTTHHSFLTSFSISCTLGLITLSIKNVKNSTNEWREKKRKYSEMTMVSAIRPPPPHTHSFRNCFVQTKAFEKSIFRFGNSIFVFVGGLVLVLNFRHRRHCRCASNYSLNAVCGLGHNIN